MTTRVALFLLMGFLQVACVSKMLSKAIPQEKKESKRVEKVKTVAIVAYDTLEFVPSGLGSKVAPIIGTAQSVSNMSAVESELSLNLYNDLSSELQRLNFKILPLSKVRSNHYYQHLLSKMSDKLSKATLNEFQKPTRIKGLARPINPKYQFSEEERVTLARKLNVDAIVYARVSYLSPSDTDYLGLGLSKSYLQPIFSFYMFGGEKSELIWYAAQFAGPRSEESLGRISGLEDKTKIAKMSRPLGAEAIKLFLNKQSTNQ